MFGRGGKQQRMQVHAVPDSERATDEKTKARLPWGYEYPNTTSNENEIPEPTEKGPFGRSVRRSRTGLSRSRSKTVEPRREEDKIRTENIAAEDAMFAAMRRVATREEERDGPMPPVAKAVPEAEGDPTEVILYGFGEDMQWSAIDFYERVSNGYILEDYERTAPGARYDIVRSANKKPIPNNGTWSRATLRKKNKYAGGEHWIKVTFDSQTSAELAIARQPHIIRGYMVYAELFQGRGPQKDAPVLATQAGAQITSDNLPSTFSTNPPGGSPNSSETLSSATVTGTPDPHRFKPTGLGWRSEQSASPSGSSATMSLTSRIPSDALPTFEAASAALEPRQARHPPGKPRRRIEGVTPATVLPAELALAPKTPRSPWLSWLQREVIGTSVPRNEDNSFDWTRASFYWRLFYLLDGMLGTDMCGLKEED